MSSHWNYRILARRVNNEIEYEFYEVHYENDWKPGVVYATGAVILGDQLMVYYGGGDKHVCIAQTPLKELLNWLVEFGKV